MRLMFILCVHMCSEELPEAATFRNICDYIIFSIPHSYSE